MKRISLISIVITCSLLTVLTARPCTTFVLRGKQHLYFGRNLDWNSEDALVIVNARNVQKTAFLAPGSVAAKWTSKYGSVTFNSSGWDLPTGGMNEAGLVVENMWLDDTGCPGPDARPAINPLQWIQYQLDTCSTVPEVLATDHNIRVEMTGFPVTVHYLVSDASGDCATIEFLNGAMVCHRGKNLPYPALANDAYEASAAYAKSHPEPAGANKQVGNESLARFTHAASRAANFKSTTLREDLDYAFGTLDQVCQGDFTVWRLVYDLTARQIHYRTRSHPEERVLDLKQLDFTPGNGVKFFDLRRATGSGGTPKFELLSEAKHREYLNAYLGQAWVKQQFGDMGPSVEAMLVNLRGYTISVPGQAGHSLVPEAVVNGSMSAQEILRKSIEARGGKQVLAHIQSYHAKGTLDLPWLKDSQLEVFATKPAKLVLVAQLKPTPQSKGGQFRMGTDGQVAWEAQPGAAPAALTGKQAQERCQSARFLADCDDFDDCQSATYLGQTLFEGRNCHVLRLVKKAGEETTNYYDAANCLLAGSLDRATIQNVPTWQTSTFQDYQGFGGFQFATHVHFRTQRSDCVLHFASIDLNGVEDSVFKLPDFSAQAGVPK
jgi:choloylglycine hydrolase